MAAGRWRDKVLYWAWEGSSIPDSAPPTKKRIEYAQISYPRWKSGPITMSLAVTVFDDDVSRFVNRNELEWHMLQGAEVTMPSRNK